MHHDLFQVTLLTDSNLFINRCIHHCEGASYMSTTKPVQPTTFGMFEHEWKIIETHG